MRRIASITLVFILFTGLMTGCNAPVELNQNGGSIFSSYRDIPSVTEDEISIIENLIALNDTFIFGMPPSNEAYLDTYGEMQGIAVLFSRWMSQLFGASFNVEIFSSEDFFTGFNNKEIDFTIFLTPTDQRRQIYSMLDLDIHRPVMYYRLRGSEPLSEIRRTRLPVYALVENSPTANDILGKAINDFDYVLIPESIYAYELLKSGKVDAFVSTASAEAVFAQFEEVISEYYLPQMHTMIALSTANPALEPFLSIVSKAMDFGVSSYFEQMYKTSRQDYLRYRFLLHLTPEERNYILNNPVVKMGALHYNYPIDFFNDFENKWQGAIFDILDEVTALTGMSFEVATDVDISRSELLKELERGDISFIPQLNRTPEREDKFIWPDAAMMHQHYILISRMGYPRLSISDVQNTRVGLVKDNAYSDVFVQLFPNHTNSFIYGSVNDAVDALARGDVDVMMGSMIQLLTLTNYEERTGFKANLVFDYTYDVLPGFNKNEEILVSILDKALQYINVEGITEHWMRTAFDYNAMVLKAQRPWLIGAIVLTCVVIVLGAVLIFVLSSSNKRMTKLVAQRTGELENETSKLRTIMDSVPDIIFCKDNDSKFIQFNKVMTGFYGVKEEDLIGKGDVDGLGIPEEIARRFIEGDNLVRKEKRKVTGEEWVMSCTGSMHLLETIKAPLIQNGDVAGIVGIARDITVRKEMEDAIQSANEAKSAFLATMSHEIRTPMNSIMGFAELALENEDLSPKLTDYLKKITDSSKLLLHIVNDILDISKIESGKMDIEQAPFYLYEVVARCESVVFPNVVDKGLKLDIYQDMLPGKKLIGDSVRLYQVLINLLSNAVKFTNSGMISLNVKTTYEDENSISLLFEVKDCGIGMTDDQIKKVFEPFVQADTSTTRNYGGTGLGLSITKSIIDLMGGTLEVESVPGEGTTFRINLSFFTVNSESETPEHLRLGIIEKPNFDGLILICDDNPLNQQVVCEHLSNIGIKSITADNGKVGLDIVTERMQGREKPFDLILMDMFMPVMDGLEASTKIMALKTGTPIVAMTANIMANELENYRKHGIPDCLGKPFTSQELWRILLKYLKPVSSEHVDEEKISEKADEIKRKMQINFVRSNQSTFNNFIDAIISEDRELAHRIAHTLKGNAGQIGEVKLQLAAQAVELLLKTDLIPITDNNINLMKTELMSVLEKLEPLFEEIPTSAPGVVLNEKEEIELLEKIKPMLKTGDVKCLKLLDEIRSVSGAEKLIGQIEILDFELAYDTLEEMLKKRNEVRKE